MKIQLQPKRRKHLRIMIEHGISPHSKFPHCDICEINIEYLRWIQHGGHVVCKSCREKITDYGDREKFDYYPWMYLQHPRKIYRAAIKRKKQEQLELFK